MKASNLSGQTEVANSVLVGNCAFFEDQPFTYWVDHCRALGNTLSIFFTGGEQASIVNSTVYGQGDGLVGAGPREDFECRGTESISARNSIFLGDADRRDLLERLASVVAETGARVYAWALMPNHFHVLIQSGPVRLSTVMRRILTGYAVSFNRRYRRVGHLFQNRYKSILVEKETYLLELVRYIHLHPLRGRLVENINELYLFPWSGHAVLMGGKG